MALNLNNGSRYLIFNFSVSRNARKGKKNTYLAGTLNNITAKVNFSLNFFLLPKAISKRGLLLFSPGSFYSFHLLF